MLPSREHHPKHSAVLQCLPNGSETSNSAHHSDPSHEPRQHRGPHAGSSNAHGGVRANSRPPNNQAPYITGKPYILDSGAKPTHLAQQPLNPQCNHHRITTTARGTLCSITHTKQLHMRTNRNKSISLPAVHTPEIAKNLISVHDLTIHGDVTFTRIKATLHAPTPLPPHSSLRPIATDYTESTTSTSTTHKT